VLFPYLPRRRTAATLALVLVLVGFAPTASIRQPVAAGFAAAAAQRHILAEAMLDAAGLAGIAMQATDSGDDPILSPAQFTRAVVRRWTLPAPQRARLDVILAGLARPEAQAYLLKSFAAGHSVDEIAGFANALYGRTPEWLSAHLTLIDPVRPGLVRYLEASVEQMDPSTCGSTAIVVARAMTDPMYAFALTTGGRPDGPEASAPAFTARLKSEEQRIHRATNVLWPRVAGTTPWAVSRQLGQRHAEMGAVYGWRVFVGGVLGGAPAGALRDALAAVDQGYPVPVLIGDGIPRHYVLLVRHDDDGLLFYQPTGGEIVRVPDRDFRRRNLGVLGFSDVKAMITPRP
jgi:hypothetical protein